MRSAIPSSQKSTTFFETFGFLILAFDLLTPFQLFADWFTLPLIILDGASLLLLLAGLWFESLQKVSAFALVLTGLSMIVGPNHLLEGTLLILIANVALFRANWFQHKPAQKALIEGAMIFLAQVGGLALAQAGARLGLARVIVLDLGLAFLIFTYRKDFIEVRVLERPTLCMGTYDLTPRERQIIQLIWNGQTSKEIAGILVISDGTVRNNLSQIYRKLKLPGSKELFALVHSHQIVWEESEESDRGEHTPSRPER